MDESLVKDPDHDDAEEHFTKDIFRCGICLKEKESIIEYVKHMIVEEKCTLILHQSSIIKNLLLPRFKKQKEQEKIEEIKNDTLPLEEGNLNFEVELDTTLANEVETGFGLRWKCKICFLTFSRKSAIANHLKLLHQPKEETNEPTHLPQCLKHESTESLNLSKISPLKPSKANSKNEFSSNDTSNNQNSNFCNICGQLCKTRQTLIAHVQIVHSDERQFTCKIDGCFLSFKTKGSLVRHQRRHTDDRPFKCSLCGRSFRESGSLQRHKQSKNSCLKKTSKDRYGITMPLKSSCIEPKEEENSPLSEEVSNDQTSIPLPEDSKTVIWQQILYSSKNDNSKTTTKCSPAAEKSTEVNLKSLKVEIPSDIQAESSTDDHINFDEKKVLKSEMGPPSGPLPSILRVSFSCPICPKYYSKNSNLLSHLKIHLNEMGTECSYCKKNFNTSHALSRHMFCHSSIRQYECSQCGKMFKLKSHALSHLAAHSQEKKFSCVHCGRPFKTVSSRNHHLKIHVGEKDFQCSVCFKSFLVKASLERHLRIHTGEKPFVCPHCHRAFKEHGTLSRHLNNKMPCTNLSKNSNPILKDNLADVPNECVKCDQTPKTDPYPDDFSDLSSELDDYLNDRIDLSSIYSESSEMSFDSREDFTMLFEDELPPLETQTEFRELHQIDPTPTTSDNKQTFSNTQ